jgi:hypothetical protein
MMRVDAGTLHFAAWTSEWCVVDRVGVYPSPAHLRAALILASGSLDKLRAVTNASARLYEALFGVKPPMYDPVELDEPDEFIGAVTQLVRATLGIELDPIEARPDLIDVSGHVLADLSNRVVSVAQARFSAGAPDDELWDIARRAKIVDVRIADDWPGLSERGRGVLLRNRRVDARLFICRRVER